MINEKPKMLKKQYNTSRLYLVVALIIVFFSAITIFAIYNLIVKKPEVSHDIPFRTDTISSVGTVDDGTGEKKDNTTIIGGLTYTRRDDVYNFLVIGESLQLQTDAMMVVNYDVANDKVSVMQLPRDTYIGVGSNYHTLNCYFTGEYNSGVRSGADKSTLRETVMDSLASFVEQNLNIKIDYWVLVNLQAFRNIVDIIGGVEVTVEHDMFYEDPDQDLYIDLKAGTQLLDGDKSEQFVRYRDTYALADKGRLDAQKIFMTALLDKVKSSFNVSTVTKMIQEAINNVTTSLTAQECVYFATEVLGIDFNNVTMMSLPTNSVYDSGWYEVMNRNDTLTMINRYMNVYQEDIVDSIFDIDHNFTNEKKTKLHNSYLAITGIDHDGYTAAEIEENSIHIPVNK